jgi:hypothetical protein
MTAATAQQTNARPQFFKATITPRLIKSTRVLIAKPPVEKSMVFGF